MILPIHTYGSPSLRERALPVETDSPELQGLIDDMIETMHGAAGIGLAAPQVGRSERVFVVDLSAMAADFEEELGAIPSYARGPIVFINPEIDASDASELVAFEEGCLSIPDIRENVSRPNHIHVRFLNRDFEPGEMEADGMLARVLQHEYDHLEGRLFVDLISPLRRRLLQRRLRAMSRGEAEAEYPLVTAR